MKRSLNYIVIFVGISVFTAASIFFSINGQSEVVKYISDKDSISSLDVSLSPKDSIESIDSAVDPKGMIHLVWFAKKVNPNEAWSKKDQVWYIRAKDDGTPSLSPVLIEPDRGGVARLVDKGKELHILFGSNLQHFVSTNNGDTWEKLPEIVPATEGYVQSFDVISDGQSMLIAYFIGKKMSGSTELRIIRWQDGSIKNSSSIKTPISELSNDSPSPKLFSNGKQYHMLVASNGRIRETKQKGEKQVEVSSTGSRLYCLTSYDALAWSQPVEIQRDNQNDINSLELLSVKNKLFAFFSSYGIYYFESNHSIRWSKPIRIASYRESYFMGTHKTDSISGVSDGNHAKLFWIDERFRKSDKSLLNPLGGFPWSDDPYWSNNDILSIDLSQVFRGEKNIAKDKVGRLTQDSSFSRMVRTGFYQNHIYVVWVGREKVGKRLDSYDESERIFITRLRLSS